MGLDEGPRPGRLSKDNLPKHKKIGISGIKGVTIYPKFKFSPIALTFLEHMGVGVSFNPVPDRLHTARVEIGSRFRIRVPVLVFVDTPY